MAIARCAICGMSVEVTVVPGETKYDRDLYLRLCKLETKPPMYDCPKFLAAARQAGRQAAEEDRVIALQQRSDRHH